jgi:curved DNA-binding protein
VDYYKALNIDNSATQSDIKKAYRDLVKLHHPDKGGSESKFKEISEAYETLGDLEKKEQYDLKRRPFRNKRQHGFNYSFNKFDGNFSQMFDNTFDQNAKGSDITIRVRLTLDDVYHGTTKYIDTGSQQFNIRIPKGIYEGAKLKIKGKGMQHPINSSAPNGDVILIMDIMRDSSVIVTDNDIWVDLVLPFYDMLLGGSFEIKTPFNSFKINVPKNSIDGKVLRIAGKGFPIYNTDNYGNLMVKLRSSNIELSKGQMEHIQHIKDLENE